MKRWFGIAVVTMGMALPACSNKQKAQPAPQPGETAPAFTPAPDNQAVIGSWSDGGNTFHFRDNGTYQWLEVVPCGAPTCQENQRASGTYQFRSGRILLGGGAGAQGDLSVTYSFSNNQNTLSLSDGAKSWTLNRR
jgi:hypothetical protein